MGGREKSCLSIKHCRFPPWLRCNHCVWLEKPISSRCLQAARLLAERFAPDGPCSILEMISFRFLAPRRLLQISSLDSR